MAVFKCCNPRIQVPTNMYVKEKKNVSICIKENIRFHIIYRNNDAFWRHFSILITLEHLWSRFNWLSYLSFHNRYCIQCQHLHVFTRPQLCLLTLYTAESTTSQTLYLNLTSRISLKHLYTNLKLRNSVIKVHVRQGLKQSQILYLTWEW